MSFNKHYELEGKHAFLSASNYRWLKYDKNKLIDVYNATQAVERGTILHEYAATAIRLKRKQPKTKETVWLGTSPHTRAEAFYRKSGWKEIGMHGKEIKFEMTFDSWNKQKSAT